jgi:hypothetical protein
MTFEDGEKTNIITLSLSPLSSRTKQRSELMININFSKWREFFGPMREDLADKP